MNLAAIELRRGAEAAYRLPSWTTHGQSAGHGGAVFGLGADGQGAAERGQPVGHPCRPVPCRVVAVSNPAPSSVTVNWRLPSEQERPTVARDAFAYW